MSDVVVYGIRGDGAVPIHPLARVNNPHACAPYIWSQLAAKYGVPDPMYRRAMSGHDRDRLWSMRGTGILFPQDDIVLGFTFDAVWVRRSNIARLHEALEVFWSRHAGRVDDTIPRLLVVLNGVEGDESLAGVCFNQTSVNENPWAFPDPEVDDGEERPFRFGVDGVDRNGATPHELFGDNWGSREGEATS